MNFYQESIKHLVERRFDLDSKQPLFHPPYANPNALPPPTHTLGSNAKPCSVSALDFEMWVNGQHQRDSIQCAYHIYTQSTHRETQIPALPLENLYNWRSCFPYLSNLLQNRESEAVDCDIIFLESNLSFMSAYPHPQSRLGIHFELDVAPHTFDPSNAEWVWSSTTNLYENGQSLHFAAKEVPSRTIFDPHTQSTVVKMKPIFESEWWAKSLGKLTNMKLGNTLSDDRIRKFFKSLTAVQEISAAPVIRSERGKDPELGPEQRMMIVVWKFRQTREGDQAGTTSWRKLTLPPNRREINSPTGMLDRSMKLPSLDAVVDQYNAAAFALNSQPHIRGEEIDVYADSNFSHEGFDLPDLEGTDYGQGGYGYQHHDPNNAQDALVDPAASNDLTRGNIALDYYNGNAQGETEINVSAPAFNAAHPSFGDMPFHTSPPQVASHIDLHQHPNQQLGMRSIHDETAHQGPIQESGIHEHNIISEAEVNSDPFGLVTQHDLGITNLHFPVAPTVPSMHLPEHESQEQAPHSMRHHSFEGHEVEEGWNDFQAGGAGFYGEGYNLGRMGTTHANVTGGNLAVAGGYAEGEIT